MITLPIIPFELVLMKGLYNFVSGTTVDGSCSSSIDDSLLLSCRREDPVTNRGKGVVDETRRPFKSLVEIEEVLGVTY